MRGDQSLRLQRTARTLCSQAGKGQPNPSFLARTGCLLKQLSCGRTLRCSRPSCLFDGKCERGRVPRERGQTLQYIRLGLNSTLFFLPGHKEVSACGENQLKLWQNLPGSKKACSENPMQFLQCPLQEFSLSMMKGGRITESLCDSPSTRPALGPSAGRPPLVSDMSGGRPADARSAHLEWCERLQFPRLRLKLGKASSCSCKTQAHPDPKLEMRPNAATHLHRTPASGHRHDLRPS